MRDALSGKTLVSILGGVSITKLKQAIYGENVLVEVDKEKQCQIIKVIPSTASAVRDSFTLIIEENEPYPPSTLDPVHSLFLRVGSVKLWPDTLGPVGATLSASSSAFFALMLEGAVDGAVDLGNDRAEAMQMAAAARYAWGRWVSCQRRVAQRGEAKGCYSRWIDRSRPEVTRGTG